jgi:hypothetical protein
MKKYIFILFIGILAAGCRKKGGPGPAPGAAILIAPAKDLPCFTGTVVSQTESSVAFSWNAADNASAYTLTIKNLLTATESTQETTTPNATVTLLRNTPYAWHVKSKASRNTIIADSEVWKFYNAGPGITTFAPYPAELLTPTFGQLFDNGTSKVNLTWKGSAVDNNITGYIVYFGPKANPDVFRERTTDSFVNDVTVSSNTTYYWRVVSIDANGNISDSGISNFYVK